MAIRISPALPHRAILMMCLLAAALALAVATGARTRSAVGERTGAQNDARAEVCAVALATLLRGLDPGSRVYVVPALGDSTGAWHHGEVAVKAAARAARVSGRRVEFAAQGTESGSWARPADQILIALRNVRIGPGARLAWLEMDVTGSDGVTRALRFSLKREGGGWVPIEWGPAENES